MTPRIEAKVAAISTGAVRVDLMVMPRTAGGDLGTELSSDYGCPRATSVVPDPPRDRAPSGTMRPGRNAAVIFA